MGLKKSGTIGLSLAGLSIVWKIPEDIRVPESDFGSYWHRMEQKVKGEKEREIERLRDRIRDKSHFSCLCRSEVPDGLSFGGRGKK